MMRFIQNRLALRLIPHWAWERILWPREIYARPSVKRHYVGWHSQPALCVALEEIVTAWGGSIPMAEAVAVFNAQRASERTQEEEESDGGLYRPDELD